MLDIGLDFLANLLIAIEHLWQSMDVLGRIDVTLLAMMLVNTLLISCHRFYIYKAARGSSRTFIRDAALPLRNGRFDDVIAVAARNNLSHVASVVAASLAAFASAPPQFTHVEVMEFVKRACQRSRKAQAASLRLGLGTLRSIASSAPFIGLLGTCSGILNAFRGAAMEKSAFIARTNSDMATALVTTAMGLLVAIPATWLNNYFCSLAEVFQTEMSNAELETITYLNSHSEGCSQSGQQAAQSSDPFLSTPDASDVWSWEVPYDRQRGLLLATGGCALYVMFLILTAADWSSLLRKSSDDHAAMSGWTDEQVLLSPDHRYRAIIPMTWHDAPGKSSSCGSNTAMLTIIPNDRALTWKPYLCGKQTRQALEPNEALEMSLCDLPLATWRTNDELVVRPSGNFNEDLRLVEIASFPKITAIGSDGRLIHPKIVHPQLPCD